MPLLTCGNQCHKAAPEVHFLRRYPALIHLQSVTGRPAPAQKHMCFLVSGGEVHMLLGVLLPSSMSTKSLPQCV